MTEIERLKAPIHPVAFASMAETLSLAEVQLAAADAAWRDATNARAAAQKTRDNCRDALRAYVERCAGNKIALLP